MPSIWFHRHRKFSPYINNILLGLIFSAYGDGLLNHDLMVFAMVFFAAAHFFYSNGFGWRPVRPLIALPLYTLGGAGKPNFLSCIIWQILLITNCILIFLCWSASFLFIFYVGKVVWLLWGQLEFKMKICLPIYASTLLTMCWRAIAALGVKNVWSIWIIFQVDSSLLYESHQSHIFSFQNKTDILKIIRAGAACLFVVSDTALAIDKFLAPFPYGAVSLFTAISAYSM